MAPPPQWLMRGHLAVFLACLLTAGSAASAGAEAAAAPAALPVAAGASEPPADDVWKEAMRLEDEGWAMESEDLDLALARYAAAAERYETVAGRRAASGTAWWRAARCHWLIGENLPTEERKTRLARYERARDLASKGIEAEASCAECMLWKFTALGRIQTVRGVMSGLGDVPEMAELLERGIALRPTHRDGDANSTLGNLHYGSAIFYRVVPDWFWLGWFLGVRGDKDRALGHARTALDLHPTRLDYRIELGSQLLCLGTSRREQGRLSEGTQLLSGIVDRPPQNTREARHLAAARIMLDRPSKSCGYTGDEWVEIDEETAMGSAGG